MTQLDDHGFRILAFIERYQRQHHRSPTFEEIGTATGIASKDHVSRDLRRLEKMGYITYTPRVSRSIVLLKDGRARSGRSLALSSIGRLSPRRPIPRQEPQDQPLDWSAVVQDIVNEPDAELLQVNGESMVDALVHDGDLLVLRRRQSAENGEFVAVWLKPERRLTLKYYFRENGHVRLEPANPEVAGLIVQPNDVEIQGQVLAIVRKSN